MSYYGWTNRATWDANLYFDGIQEERRQELINDVLDEIFIAVCDNGTPEKAEEILQELLEDKLFRTMYEIEGDYNAMLEARIEGMTTQEAKEYGQYLGNEQVDFLQMAMKRFCDCSIAIASGVDESDIYRVGFGKDKESALANIDIPEANKEVKELNFEKCLEGFVFTKLVDTLLDEDKAAVLDAIHNSENPYSAMRDFVNEVTNYDRTENILRHYENSHDLHWYQFDVEKAAENLVSGASASYSPSM